MFACCTLALVQGAELPAPAELGVAPAAFLNGLAEAVSATTTAQSKALPFERMQR